MMGRMLDADAGKRRVPNPRAPKDTPRKMGADCLRSAATLVFNVLGRALLARHPGGVPYGQPLLVVRTRAAEEAVAGRKSLAA